MIMANFLLLILSAVAAIAHPNQLYISTNPSTRNIEQGFRLPTDIAPSSYQISLTIPETVFTGNSTEFFGSVSMTISSLTETNIIQLHSPGPIPGSEISLETIPVGLEGIMNVSSTFFNETTEILTINLENNLTANVVYTLTISNYTAVLDTTEMRGFYRSSYIDENNITQYLVTTQFQPTYARKAFPCFDEPKYKTVFRLTITHPNDTTALFNSANETETANGSMTITSFANSPFMSSYLVAFVVSKFTCTAGEPVSVNIPHYVCSTPESEADRGLANEFSASIMQSLENFTNFQYERSGPMKVHQVAIPDFGAGAMENWGLVTYREMALLYNDTSSSNADRQRVLTIIAHEFAHMWFGNLLTCHWWDVLFLNEGFASYFEYFTPATIPALINENWELNKQFVIDQQQNVFVADGFLNSNALTSPAETPSQIWGKFNSISYLKGASILRMIENIMGTQNLMLGIRRYITNRMFNTVVPSDLWAALQLSLPIGLLPGNTSLAYVMSNWINSPGYPLVTVHARGNDVFLTQKRFLYDGSSTTEWYIPISYTLSSNTLEFSNTVPKVWVLPHYMNILTGVLANNSWVIINNQESAYYRVNYDNLLWSRIIDHLSINHTSIDVLNRAQIVDDALNLARAKELTYSQAFAIIDYLRNETEYYPWLSAINGFDFLLRVLGETSPAGITLLNLQRELLQAVQNTVSFTINSANHIETLKARLILGRVCRLGEEACVNSARRLFRNYTTGVSVDRNLKTIVYCNGLRYSSDWTDWHYLWTQLRDSKVASEHITILSALGCTRNTTNLEYYLEQSITENSIIRRHDISRVWTSVLSSNPEGIEVALNYFMDNWERIYAYHSGAGSLLSSVASRVTTDDQLRRLREFSITTNLTESIQGAAQIAINTVDYNTRFATAIRPQLEHHFRTGRASLSYAVPSAIVLLIIVSLSLLTQ